MRPPSLMKLRKKSWQLSLQNTYTCLHWRVSSQIAGSPDTTERAFLCPLLLQQPCPSYVLANLAFPLMLDRTHTLTYVRIVHTHSHTCGSYTHTYVRLCICYYVGLAVGDTGCFNVPMNALTCLSYWAQCGSSKPCFSALLGEPQQPAAKHWWETLLNGYLCSATLPGRDTCVISEPYALSLSSS